MPHQQDPNTLWPAAAWLDISETYAGLFFRVLGGKSADFGVMQNEDAPRVDRIVTRNRDGLNPDREVKLEPGKCSLIGSGGRRFGWTCLDICVVGEEIRPVNKAVKVWKRQ
ncbi:unnamed protein product [Allacma fusca]|uniref:Uncharacterized protein n=1 Tax=Allacma fusca TaxID=39272 RepID=A0A8J2PPZ5_9HEXA|nr:unnamed protein product [Allacma fusca]